MEFSAIITAVTLVSVVVMLLSAKIAAEYILFGGLGVLILTNVLSVEEAFAGLANEGVATVAILFVVASSLSQSGLLSQFSHMLLGKPKSMVGAQLRLMLPVAMFSSILNNTPVVAMSIPIVSDWCRRQKLAVSKLMIPLSFAAIIGGVCTVIGTSTNLVINDMLKQQLGHGLGLFDLAWIGVPCLIVVVIFIIAFSRWLLPDRDGRSSGFEDVRQYTVEMVVDETGVLVGKTVEAAGLRELPGLYLAEIIRNKQIIPMIGPLRVLQANDRLVFAGNVDAVIELKKITGLSSAENQVFKLSDTGARSLVEVVVSNEYPLLNKTVKESNFRRYYGAVIIALSRSGQQIKQRLGDMVLKPGDTLLLESSTEFVEKQRFSKDFLVVSPVAEYVPLKSQARWFSLFALIVMLVSVGVGWLTMFQAGCVAVGIMLVTGATNLRASRESINASVLLIIAASMGLGVAMEKSGLAVLISETILSPFSSSPMVSLALIFCLTALFSAVISNVAAAVLLFPIAVASANAMGVSITPFAVAIMVSASASFATPIGYQTNLMVYGPGGYTFNDFVRIGVPLTCVVGVVSVLLIPQVWPF